MNYCILYDAEFTPEVYIYIATSDKDILAFYPGIENII